MLRSVLAAAFALALLGCSKDGPEVEIEGKTYDEELIELAVEATEEKGDGRISKEDAAKLLAAVKDGDRFSDVEKATLKRLRTHYKWTRAADEWFRAEVGKWNLEGR